MSLLIMLFLTIIVDTQELIDGQDNQSENFTAPASNCMAEACYDQLIACVTITSCYNALIYMDANSYCDTYNCSDISVQENLCNNNQTCFYALNSLANCYYSYCQTSTDTSAKAPDNKSSSSTGNDSPQFNATELNKTNNSSSNHNLNITDPNNSPSKNTTHNRQNTTSIEPTKKPSTSNNAPSRFVSPSPTKRASNSSSDSEYAKTHRSDKNDHEYARWYMQNHNPYAQKYKNKEQYYSYENGYYSEPVSYNQPKKYTKNNENSFVTYTRTSSRNNNAPDYFYQSAVRQHSEQTTPNRNIKNKSRQQASRLDSDYYNGNSKNEMNSKFNLYGNYKSNVFSNSESSLLTENDRGSYASDSQYNGNHFTYSSNKKSSVQASNYRQHLRKSNNSFNRRRR